MNKNFKSTCTFIFFFLAGIILGGFIAYICEGKSYVDWLSWGKSIGFNTTTFDLEVITFSLGLRLKVTVAQVFTIAAMLIICAKVSKKL